MSRIAKFAGVLPPTTKPTLRIDRKPLWRPNKRGTAAADNDPLAASGTLPTLYHFQSTGNAYLRQPWNSAMAWNGNSTPGNGGVFAFKCLIKPHYIDGRRLIYSTKGELNSGGVFVDMLDGKARVGWYDTAQKREVWVETNVPVFSPHHWHYLYVRKRFPDPTLNSCWQDSVYSLTAGYTYDSLVVRRFRREAAATANLLLPWDYVPTYTAGGRLCVSFTTDQYAAAGGQGTGLVSHNTRTFTIGAVPSGGTLTASGACFTPDMVGMRFCIGYTSPGGVADASTGLEYVISSYTSSTVVNIIDPLTAANAPNMAAAHTGGVYMGTRLVRSEGYATAKSPDKTEYDIELFGSHLAKNGDTKVLPFVGEFDSFAYCIGNPSTGGCTAAQPGIFEVNNETSRGGIAADDIDNGTDQFAQQQVYDNSSGGVERVSADATTRYTFTAVNTRPWAAAGTNSSTVPNSTLEVAVDASPSSLDAKPLTWKFLSDPTDLTKQRKIRLAFYDPDQAQVSNPGPEYVVQPCGDDASNPSGKVSFVLSGLPAPRDGGNIETWVYMTLGQGATLFKVAEAALGASSVTFEKNDLEIGEGEPLEVDNNPPPACSVIETSQNVLAFGGLRALVNSESGDPVDVPDGVIYSKPYIPTAVPGDNFFQFPAGSGKNITMLRDFNGALLVGKEDVVAKATTMQGGAAYEVVSPSVGCRSPNSCIVLDDACMWIGDCGPYVYGGSGFPQWIGADVEHFFKDNDTTGHMARRYAAYAVATANRRRGQYVVAIREVGSDYFSHRMSIEPTEGRVRISRYSEPNLTALGEFFDRAGGPPRLVGGTDSGFVVWLDRQDTQLVMLGSGSAWGASALVASTPSTTSKIAVTGTLDTSLAGPRGARVKWGTTEAVVLCATSGFLHLDKPVTAAPTNLTALTLGVRTCYWKTRWLDFEAPENSKAARYLDVLHTVGSGTVSVTAYMDFGSTAYPLKPISLANSYTRIPINHLRARHFQFVFESTDLFELTEVVVRVSDADPF